VIHQRYLIALKGNHQELEVSSNVERLQQAVPYEWKPDAWYTLKTLVESDPAAPGAGFVHAKVWPRGEPEPGAWTISVPVVHLHPSGSPGLFGFTPQVRFRVYVDNLKVTSNA